MINLFTSVFSKTPEKYDIPLMMCLFFAMANILRLRDLKDTNNIANDIQCVPNKMENICREITCSYLGKHHVAYGFNLTSADTSGYAPSAFTFYLLMFAPALIIGDWAIPLINASVALGSRVFASQDMGEVAALWCLNSFWIGFFVIYYIVCAPSCDY
jgi:hypothetical protein